MSEPSLPGGFVYKPEFLSSQEEIELLEAVKGEPFDAMDFHGYTAKRRIMEYGLEYDFGSRRTNATRTFPPFLLPIRERAARFAEVGSIELAEGLIIEYPPGAPIGWHRDAPQFGIVIGISLLNSARMRFKPYKKEGKIVSVELEPRSIYVMRDSVRWEWMHSIPAHEKLRYSITFRTLQSKPSQKSA